MAFNLIDEKEVSTNKLLSLFKAAFIKAEPMEDSEGDIRLEINDDMFWLIRTYHDRLKLFDYQQGHIISGYEAKILQKISEFNDAFAVCKITTDFSERESGNFRVFVTYEFRFNQGLNFAQLVDDIHFFIKVKTATFVELKEFLKAESLLFERTDDKIVM